MREGTFYTSLLVVSSLVGTVVALLHSNIKFRPYALLSIAGMTTFIVLNIAVYHLARYYSAHSLDKKYMALIYGNLASKFVIALSIPITFYFYYGKPPGAFILPFLLIYIVYTVYETWMLNKMAIMRK
jgi:CDP-diglyceride synthetase